MAGTSPSRQGFTLVELLVVMLVIGILISLLLPAVQYARESGRRAACKNNLRQLGVALHNYHGAHEAFPPGCAGDLNNHVNPQAWGWAALLLPYLEQESLFDGLDPTGDTLRGALDDQRRQVLMSRELSLFRCPSDPSGHLTHNYRLLTAFDPSQPTRRFSSWHPVPIDGGAGLFGIATSTSNYVGSFGDFWDPTSGSWSIDELKGNGLLGSNAQVRLRDIADGSSHTFAAGERTWHNYAAAWIGVDGWDRCDSQGLPMVLGTAYYRLNIDPEPYNLSCNGLGSVGYSSMHGGGAQFLFADGSVHFVGENVSFQNGADPGMLGVYQRLARRNDGRATGL